MRSKRQTTTAWAWTLLLAASVAVAEEPGRARPGSSGGETWQIELFVSTLTARSVTEGGFGLRSAYRRSPRLAFEGSLSRAEEIWLPDLSVKLSLRPNRRNDVYLVGGPGLLAINDFDDTVWMFHAGLGAQISLGKKLYLRPEVRGRWFVDGPDAVTVADVSVGLGWRF